MKQFTALLATARIANVPSVVSNVLLGSLIVGSLGEISVSSVLLTAFAACMLYVAGNFLNDWYDVAWDQEYRSERAIPSGLFRRNTYFLIALSLATGSLGIGFSQGLVLGMGLCIIAILVIVYTMIHKKSSYGVWVMGSCRAMLYVVGFLSVNGDDALGQLARSSAWELPLACAGMLCYIAGISLLAKKESKSQDAAGSLVLPRLLVFAPIVTHGLVFAMGMLGSAHAWHVLAHAALVFGGWTYLAVMKQRPIGERVARLLMGIPLIDGIRISALGGMQLIDGNMTSSSILFVVPFFAFLLAGLLQKVAPAS